MRKIEEVLHLLIPEMVFIYSNLRTYGFVLQMERNKIIPSKVEVKKLKDTIKISNGTKSPISAKKVIQRKKRPKGPNPLSMKKKKKTNSNNNPPSSQPSNRDINLSNLKRKSENDNDASNKKVKE
jgi:U3 small nucleolar RNA-associated protein 23